MTNVLNITTDDLKLAYEGVLVDERIPQYQNRIDQAVRMLQQHGVSRQWSLLAGIDANLIDVELVKDIVLRAVARVLRNESGMMSENEDGYGYQLNPNTASGELRIFPSEIDQIFPAHPRKTRKAVSHSVQLGNGWGPW